MEDGIIFEIQVQHNFGLERLILGFGDSIEVIKTAHLRKQIYNKLKTALGKYGE